MSSKVKAAASSFCPIPHTFRDQVWLVVGAGLGLSIGVFVGARYFSRTSNVSGGSARPRVLPGPSRVVDIPSIKIDEHAGNSSNGDAGISIAEVVVVKACVEATQRPQFDEYVLVQSGVMNVKIAQQGSSSPAYEISAGKGQMLHLPRGFLYTYSFPGPCTYVPVCLPAFTPALSGRIED